jgi:hypothetical protein
MFSHLMMKVRNIPMLKKGDLILVIGIIFAVVLGSIFLRFYYSNVGDKIAIIKQNNKVLKSINLNTVTKPEEFKIAGTYSEVILIEKGRIRFKEANCPDKLCVKKGWLTRNGEMAVCLPGRAIIEIKGSNDKIDGVAY